MRLVKKILGISAYYHDSAAAVIVNGEVIAAAQEERFTREKHTAAFPANAIRYCLQEAGIEISELDAVVFYDKPFLKFERLLETYYAFAPKGLISFLKAIPVWLREKLYLRKHIHDGLSQLGAYRKNKLKLLFTEHHLSHAASAFFVSPFRDAAILTIDGVGEWTTASIAKGSGNTITTYKEMYFPHSAGLLYSAFTYFLGFTVNSGEYKLMGLAPYGDKNAEQTKHFERIIREQLVEIKEDGSIWMNPAYFTYATGLRMVNNKKWKVLFGFDKREEDEEIRPHHANLAMAIQVVTEDIVIRMAREAKRITGAENLCMAGGVALNCVANGRLQEENIFSNIYIQPAAGDAGGALGAALATHFIYYGAAREPGVTDGMKGTYLGPAYDEREVLMMCRNAGAVAERYTDQEKLDQFIAAKLAEGNVVGWFQGRMEFGPRALGNRSILADARNHEMQQQLNLKIKNREGFRPFAPVVMEEDASAYFNIKTSSPYMLFTFMLHPLKRRTVNDSMDMPFADRLKQVRSEVPAITHLDFSARVQTVNREGNPRLYDLLHAFREQTGCSVLVNTSFNVRGEPVVCTPYDAYRCFMATSMDYLVINDFVFCKTDQPGRDDKMRWLKTFKTD